MKRIYALIVALVSLAPTLALADDITGDWEGWSCGVEDSYDCPETTGYFDNYSYLHFGRNPKRGGNTAIWQYDGFSCTSNLTYVSDIGSGVIGSYHYWEFNDSSQNGCLPGKVVVAVKVGTNEPIQVWWYANNPADSISNTFGYLDRTLQP